MRADKMQNSLNDFLDRAVKEVAEAVEEDIFNNAATRIENKLVETGKCSFSSNLVFL